MAESRDPLRNGAIFRVKDLSILRGGRAVGAPHQLPSDTSQRASPLDSLPSIIRSRFDELYRATPMPTFGPFQTLHDVKTTELMEQSTNFEPPQYVFPYPTSSNRQAVPGRAESSPQIRKKAGDSPVAEPPTVQLERMTTSNSSRKEPNLQVDSSNLGAAATPSKVDSSNLGAAATPSNRIAGRKRRLSAEKGTPSPDVHSQEPEPQIEVAVEVTDTSITIPEKAAVSDQSPLSGISQSTSPLIPLVSSKRSRMRMQDSSLLSLVEKSRPDSSPATPHPSSSVGDSSVTIIPVNAKEDRSANGSSTRRGRSDSHERPNKSENFMREKSRQKKSSPSPALKKSLSWTADEDRLLREAHRSTKINAGTQLQPRRTSTHPYELGDFWAQVASKVPGKKAEECSARWFEVIRLPFELYINVCLEYRENAQRKGEKWQKAPEVRICGMDIVEI